MTWTEKNSIRFGRKRKNRKVRRLTKGLLDKQIWDLLPKKFFVRLDDGR